MLKCVHKNDNAYDTDVSVISNKSKKSHRSQTPHQSTNQSNQWVDPNTLFPIPDVQKYTTQINKLTDTIKDQEHYYGQKLAEMAQQHSRISVDYEKQVMMLSEQLEQIRTKKTLDSEITRQYTRDIIDQEKEISQLKTRISELQTNYQLSNTHFEKQIQTTKAKHLEELGTVKNQYDQKVESLEHRIAQCQNECNAKVEYVYKSLGDKHAKMVGEELRELNDKVRQLESDNHFLSRDKEMIATELSNKYKSLENEMGFVNLRYVQLENTYTKLIEDTDKQVNQLKQEKVDCDQTYRRELRESNEKLNKFSQLYDEILVKNTKFRAELNDLLETKKKDNSEFNIQIRQLKQQHHNIKTLYDNTLVDHEKSMKTIQATYDSTLTRLNEALGEIYVLKESNDTLRVSSHKIYFQHAVLTDELKKEKELSAKLKEQNDFISSRLISLDSQTGELSARNSSLVRENSEYKIRNKKIEDAHKQLSRDKDHLHNQLKKLIDETQNTEENQDIRDHLTNQLKSSVEEYEKLKQERDELNKTLHDREIQLCHYEKKYNKIKADWNNSQLEYGKLVDEISVLKLQVKENHSTKESQLKEIQQTNADVNKIKLLSLSLEYKVSTLEKDNMELKIKEEHMARKNDELLGVIAKLQECRNEIDTLYRQSKNDHSSSTQIISDLKNININLAQTIHGKERDINMLSDRIAILSGQHKNIQLEAVELKEKINTLESAKIIAYKTHSSEILKYKQTIDTLNKNLLTLQTENKNLTQLETNNNMKVSEILNLQETNKIYSGQLSKYESRYTILHTDTSREIQQLQLRLSNLQTDLDKQTQKATSLQLISTEHNELKTHYQILLKRIEAHDKLVHDHQHLSTRFHGLSQHLEDVSANFSELKVIYSKTEAQRNTYFEKAQHLQNVQKEYQTLQLKNQQTINSLTDFKILLHTTHTELASLTTLHSQLQKEYDTSRDLSAKAKNRFDNDLTILRAKCTGLKDTLGIRDSKISSLEEKLRSTDSELMRYNDLRLQYDQLYLSAEKEGEKLKGLIKEHVELKDYYSQSQDSLKSIKTELSDKNESIREIKQKHDAKVYTATQTINNLNTQLTTLIDQKKVLVNSLEKCEHKLSNIPVLEKRIQQLESQLQIMTENYTTMEIKEKDALEFKEKYYALSKVVDEQKLCNSELQEHTNKLAESNKILSIQNSDITQKYRDILNLHTTENKKFLEYQTQNKNLQTRLIELQETTEKLTKTREDLLTKLELSPTVQQLRELSDCKEESEKQNIILANKIQRISDDLKETRKDTQKLRQSEAAIKVFETDLQHANFTINKLMSFLDSSRHELSACNKSKLDLQKDKEKQSETIKKLIAEIEGLKKLPAKLTSQLVALRVESAKLLNAGRVREQDLQMQLHDKVLLDNANKK